MAEKRSDVPWVGDGEKLLQGRGQQETASLGGALGTMCSHCSLVAPRSAQNLQPWHRKCGRRWPADGWVHACVCLLENGLRITRGFRPERERKVEEGNRNSFPLSFSHSITSIFQLQEELVCFSSGVEGS